MSFEKHGKLTRPAAFLAEIGSAMPWPELCAVVEQFCSKPGNSGPLFGQERILRLHLLEH